ncbi:MAG: HD domain-containing protein [Parcubacteria group bacterium]|jgi:putative hydrolase of HD superfamily
MNNSKKDFASIAKNGNPFELIKGRGVDMIIEIYFQISHLKQLYRRGWLRKERVSKMHCESVADHCFGMLILAWFISEKLSLELDMLRVFKMIVAHEFGEVYGGDITPVDGISIEEKYRIEQTAVRKLFQDFPGGEEYIAIWEDYDAKVSKEAKFVAQIDKLEMALQGSIYQLQHDKDFTSFIASAEKAIHDTELLDLFRQTQTL